MHKFNLEVISLRVYSNALFVLVYCNTPEQKALLLDYQPNCF